MRSSVIKISLPTLFAALLTFTSVGPAAADVNVNVNVGPPPVTVAEPPDVVLVPGTQVYFVPEVNYDVFFYNGYWWSPRGDRWYRARAYNGPWRLVARRIVPPPVYRVPHDYRRAYMHERHIPYGQWKKQGRDHDRGRRGDFEEHRGGPPWDRGEQGGGRGRGHGHRD